MECGDLSPLFGEKTGRPVTRRLLLIQSGHKLTLLKEDEINLETAFMALTKGITA